MKYLILVLALFVFANAYQGIGDRIERTYLVYKPLPLTTQDAVAGGWKVMNSTCDPNAGIAYAYGGVVNGPNPLVLYYTASGNISAIGVNAWGSLEKTLIGNFWLTNGDHYTMTVSFRSPSVICSSSYQANETIGDRVIINQGPINFTIPLNHLDAAKQQWYPGGCISKMGKHWSYDLVTHPAESWKLANLLPIMPMYNNATGAISAILVNTPVVQTAEPFGIWEEPLPGPLMCYNWCSTSCLLGEVGLHLLWNTLHLFFTDPTLNLCPEHCW